MREYQREILNWFGLCPSQLWQNKWLDVDLDSVSQPSGWSGQDLNENQLGFLSHAMHLFSLGLSACLNDDDHRIAQAVAVMGSYVENCSAPSTLLVVVRSTHLSEWLAGFSKHLPHLQGYIFRGKPSVRDAVLRSASSARDASRSVVIVATYDSLMFGWQSLRSLCRYDLLVLDDFQGRDILETGLRSKILSIERCHSLLLTGKPISSLASLWFLMNVQFTTFCVEEWVHDALCKRGHMGSISRLQSMKLLLDFLRPFIVYDGVPEHKVAIPSIEEVQTKLPFETQVIESK